MTKFSKYFLIILILDNFNVLSLAESDEECKEIENKNRFMQLQKHLLCEYDSSISSSFAERNEIEVYIALAPTIAYFDEYSGNLELVGWILIEWEDDFLTWDASSFEDIEDFSIRSYKIWVPEITVLSGGNEDSIPDFQSNSICNVQDDGEVQCLLQSRHSIRCQTDFTQWPFDRQNCSLVISTWLRTSDQISFAQAEAPTDMLELDMLTPNGEWTLTASRVFYDQRNSFFSKKKGAYSPRLTIDFILDRVHSQLSGRFISPAIIMMVMTLTTLWLDPKSVERFAVACVNPIIHLHCIRDLHWSLPHNGSTVPNLLLFYAYSLALAIMALLLTFFFEKLQEIKIEPPKWISSSMAAILRSKVGHILLLIMFDPKPKIEVESVADDSGNLVSSNSQTTWGYLAIMFNSITFIAIFLTYVIMYAVLIPNASMRPPIDGIELDDD